MLCLSGREMLLERAEQSGCLLWSASSRNRDETVRRYLTAETHHASLFSFLSQLIPCSLARVISYAENPCTSMNLLGF